MRAFLSKLGSNETFAGYMFLLPNFFGFVVFTSLPVLASLCLSFVNWDITSAPQFVGVQNFVNLLGFHHAAGTSVANDPFFWKYMYNTMYFMINIPLCMVGSLVIALLMNQKIRGIVFFRTIFFLPSICAGVAVCLLWKWLLNPTYGLINLALAGIFKLIHLNVGLPQWTQDVAWAKPSLMLMGFWSAIGGMNMILYLAALQGVPLELYEAADIDGASNWRKFWAVTLPYLTPTTFFMVVMGIIGGLQGGFMQAWVMTRGGPAGSTTTIDYYIFNLAYQWYKVGYASSIAWVLFVIIFILTMINWRFGGKLVHY